MIGQIICEYGQTLMVESQAQLYTCFLRKNLDSVVVGDQVEFEWNAKTKQGVITKRLARNSLLARSDRYHPQKEMAANIDQLVILFAPSPQPNEFYLDQYLVAAALYNLPVVLVMNKVDLLEADPHTKAAIGPLIQLYQNIGYPVVLISAKTGAGLANLLVCLETKTSFLLGSSGVGKSSLINTLLGGRLAKVQAVSLATQKGQHTTSRSTLYHLPQGGSVIDVPGIRELKLPQDKQDQLVQGFIDFKAYLGQCRFRNCTHQHEPGCMILTKVKAGVLSEQRLKHYYRMLALYD